MFSNMVALPTSMSRRSLTRREVMNLSDQREPPLWIAAFGIVFAVIGPLLVLGLFHLA